MPEGKIEKARKEIIGIIIDLLIHDLNKSSILDIISFNESDITCIDEKYDVAEKISINIARDLHFYGITIEEIEETTGINRAVFKEFIKGIQQDKFSRKKEELTNE